MKPISAVSRLLNRLQTRFRTARSGSVLILVVALLVLMALLGTAFISTARIDRYSATVNSANTQIDLLVQGIINMAVGTVVDDLYHPTPTGPFGPKEYRKPPLDGGALAGGYEHYDSPAVDLFLADRVPTLFNRAAPLTTANPPLWRSVSWPLIARADGTYWFDRPGVGASVELDGPKNQYFFVPTARTVNGQVQPFFRIFQNGVEVDTDPGTAGVQPILAADADGDGIADAGLWKIPLGAIDGVTYYAAARIIDNNSAINVNTALSRNADFGGPFPGTAVNSAMFFPSRVGLAEMLRTYHPPMNSLFNPTPYSQSTGAGVEMDRMNVFRFNMNPSRYNTDYPHGLVGTGTNPVGDAGAPSPDFDFTSIGDVMNSQIARRVAFPGPNSSVTHRYQTYGIGESMTLAYRGGLRNATVGTSLLEQHLNQSLTVGVRTSPYPASAVLAWYDALYHYDDETQSPTPVPATFRPLRSLLVASNPVANQALAHYVTGADPNGDGLRNDLPADLAPMTPYVTAAGQQANPPKVSINTAAFGDLYRAFWNVMIEQADATPVDETLEIFDPIPGNFDARTDPYYGQRFDPLPPYASIPTEQNPARMFRSVIRDRRVPPGGGGGANSVLRMLPYDVLKLRAALAAVNAIDLRDSDNNVTEELITLNVIEDTANNAAVAATTVRVFGTEAQPYITEVYANLHTGPTADGINEQGYVAIELSNPYSVAIPLNEGGAAGGWSLGLINRRAATAPEHRLTIEALDPTGADPTWNFPPGTVIPPAGPLGPGKLVLENYDPAGSGGLAAMYRPQPVTGATVYVPGLHRVFESAADATAGGELVLLRTRSGAGVAVTGPDLDGDGTADFDEVMNRHDLIPVDSFDFTGMQLTPASPVGPYLWMHYVRENGPGYEWRFVYPGRYDGSATDPALPNTTSRHQGVQMVPEFGDPVGPAPTEADILPQKPVALGLPDTVAAALGYTNPFTIQIANTDFGGHNKIGAPGSPTPPQFPFGAFARNGDILQVPFIGAYTIDSPDPGDGPDIFLEMNSVSMDSVFAEDTDTSNDPVVPETAATAIQNREQIGRFYPIMRNTNFPPFPPTAETADYSVGTADANATDPVNYNLPGEYWNFAQSGDNPLEPATYVPQWRYHWGMDLFEHLTVQAPHDDYFPDIDKSVYTTVEAVSNSGGTAGDSTVPAAKEAEYREPVEGLININTASWKVLSALPLVISDGTSGLSVNFTGTAPPAGQVFPALTRELAQIIVYYRDVDADPFTAGNQPHGPFQSIMELNKVVDTRSPDAAEPHKGPPATMELNARPGFRNAMGTITFAPGTGEPNDNQGDFSPAAAATDLVRADFEEKSLALSRISNLITTRSDSFTCYLLVQGYRDAESANPELVVERRLAFLLDRSRTVPAFPQPVVTKIPNN
ncbi:MAG TPA: hypothetical protein VGR35_11030 [Tepidisphaeraceae bacterium]|nr:hypothetical protein [Tepidisphaeraceae bacterium]